MIKVTIKSIYYDFFSAVFKQHSNNLLNSQCSKSSPTLHFFIKKPFHMNISHSEEEKTITIFLFHSDFKLDVDISATDHNQNQKELYCWCCPLAR